MSYLLELCGNKKARRRWGRNLDGQSLRDLPAS